MSTDTLAVNGHPHGSTQQLGAYDRARIPRHVCEAGLDGGVDVARALVLVDEEGSQLPRKNAGAVEAVMVSRGGGLGLARRMPRPGLGQVRSGVAGVGVEVVGEGAPAD